MEAPVATTRGPRSSEDPFDLDRFVQAQEADYEQALMEIKAGRKRSHWMWYIFPQIEGLGFSSMSQRYSIKSIDEAKAYLNHPLLGRRLRECAEAVLAVEDRSVAEMFGSPDDMKLGSCVTLFSTTSDAGSVFHRVLEKHFQGVADPITLQRLREK
jgi:uncharacterized protein (DUF1810 family)